MISPSLPLPLLLILLSLLTFTQAKPNPTPYLSPTTLFPNYQKMLQSFKIYIYTPQKLFPYSFPSPPESLFHSSLLKSNFLTQNPNEAHLFFLPFSQLPTRSLARLVREIRQSLPFWNSSLGADHFFLSRAGITYTSDRNIVELKKNSIQISSFPTTPTNFIPHKDITLPHASQAPLPHTPANGKNDTNTYYMVVEERVKSGSSWSIVNEMLDDPEIVIESQPSDQMKKSKYCVFIYDGEGDVVWLADAMASGCVPVIVTERAIQDLPLMDVLRWSEIAVVVGSGGGVKGVKEVLGGIGEERYERMRGLGVVASRHLVWNEGADAFDAFHMVMYQLWLRRHVIRYARRDAV